MLTRTRSLKHLPPKVLRKPILTMKKKKKKKRRKKRKKKKNQIKNILCKQLSLISIILLATLGRKRVISSTI